MTLAVADFAAALSGLSWRSLALRTRVGGPHSRRGSGQSQNFAGFRAFQRQDERRLIDARASARTGQPMVRLFEREAVGVLELVLDASPSMAVGHELGASKYALAAGLAVALGALAGEDAQQVGLSVLSDSARRLLPAAAHPRQAQRLLRALDETVARNQDRPAPTRGAVDTASQLLTTLGWLERRSEVVVLTDALMPHEQLVRALGRLVDTGHPTLLVQLWHPLERTLLGDTLGAQESLRFVELEGTQIFEVELNEARTHLAERVAAAVKQTQRCALEAGAAFAAVDGGLPLRAQLMQILSSQALGAERA